MALLEESNCRAFVLCKYVSCSSHACIPNDPLGALPYHVELKGLPAGIYEVQIEASDVFGFTDLSTVEYQHEACMTCIIWMYNIVSCTCRRAGVCAAIAKSSASLHVAVGQYNTTVLVTFTKYTSRCLSRDYRSIVT